MRFSQVTFPCYWPFVSDFCCSGFRNAPRNKFVDTPLRQHNNVLVTVQSKLPTDLTYRGLLAAFGDDNSL